MACGCNKNRATRPAWQPRGRQRPVSEQGTSGNGARIIPPEERAEELANAARPARARQPGAR